MACLLLVACGKPLTAAAPAAAASPTPPPVPLCNPAAADEKHVAGATPSPCIYVDPNQNLIDNARYRQRRNPLPGDAAAFGPAAVDLNRVFVALRGRRAFDVPSVSQAIAAYRSLLAARAYQPRNDEVAVPGQVADTTVVVVLELPRYGSACLIGAHGPTQSEVSVVGSTLDGGCVALYGH
jgi:hypothetical protein